MIYGKIEELPFYDLLVPGALKKIADYLKNFDPATPDGRHDLLGDQLYVSLQSYTTRELNPEKLEAHRRYLDVQLLLAGEETITVSPLSENPVVVPYKEEKDVLFARLEAPAAKIELVPGVFVLLFPEDAHLPCVGDGRPVRKAVFKISTDLVKKA